MKHPKISVIIPVYRTEAYLDRCVQSVVSQTWDNLEILLVDDGSPDRCPAMCDQWAVRDHRIRVIHKMNGGQSSARNAGLDAATGEWIGFVDSDDEIMPRMYETLLDAVGKSGKSIAYCGCWSVAPGRAPQPGREPEQTGIRNGEEMVRLMLRGEVGTAVWNKLYASELWWELRFPEGVTHEDIPVQIPLYRAADGAVQVKERLYFYRSHGDSVTHTCHLWDYGGMLRSMEAVQTQVHQWYGNRMDGVLRRFEAERAWEAVTLMDKRPHRPEKQEQIIQKRYLKQMRQNAFWYLTDAGISGKSKGLYLLTMARLLRPLKMGWNRFKRQNRRGS